MVDAIPLTVLGGYLGSGKTTLVNSLLRQASAHPSGPKIAVLVNDFGDLPIDADLIEAEDGDLISLAGGCVCCSYGDDLGLAVAQLQAMSPPPDHVLLEASGVAIPGAIAASLSLQAGVRVEAVVVLADADQIRARHRSEFLSDTVERQFEHADLVAITKTDLVHRNDIDPLVDWLRSLAPNAGMITVDHQTLPLDVMLGVDAGGIVQGRGHEKTIAPEVSGSSGHNLHTEKNPGSHSHSHSHSHDHDHGLNLYRTVSLLMSEAMDAVALAARLAAAEGVLRAKGFVRGSDGHLMTIQVVGKRSEVTAAPAEASPGLVVIGLRTALDDQTLQGLVALNSIEEHSVSA
ncbi:MAG: CobW family GTP-binding protein [Pseudomonadota bacterium]